MRFILFGAGDVGIRALKVLGENHIECFADNYKYGGMIHNKRVISFGEMIQMKYEFQIVITSDLYVELFEDQLSKANVNNYLVFNRRYESKMNAVLPSYNYLYNTLYMSYTDILLNYHIESYDRIAIYGINEYISSLLLELAVVTDLGKVVGIVDPNEEKDTVFGFPVLKLDELDGLMDCLIINKRRTESDVRDKVKKEKYDIVDVYDVDKFIYHNRHPELKKFKGLHEGKRAFIIGNGPSVTIRDLEILHENNEICFGLNKIYKIFHQTKWRPLYVCISDARVMIACEAHLQEMLNEATVFVSDSCMFSSLKRYDGLNYVHLKPEPFLPNLPGFSSDITEQVYWGNSVTYDLALPIAAYMGIKEIYLIGMDHDYHSQITDQKNHFIKDYFEESEHVIYKNAAWDVNCLNAAYQKAEEYSRENGFRIYNATRGGKLDFFERIEFDELF